MAQHFLPDNITGSLARVARLAEEEAHDSFRLIRWTETKGEAVCPRCACAVMVDGRLLIEGGRSTAVDEAEVTRAGAAAIQKIWTLPEARAAFAG